MSTTTRESDALIRSGFAIARQLGLSTLIVQADEVRVIRVVGRVREQERVVWLTRIDAPEVLLEKGKGAGPRDAVIRLPESTLTRLSQLKIGLLEATMNEDVRPDESVVCLSGVAGSARLDTLLIANPRRDFPWLDRHRLEEMRRLFAERHFARLLDVALRLAAEGREGRSVGTIFVLGDQDELGRHLRQLVLNPLEGHNRRRRSIHDPEFFETIRELAALDGAFVVDRLGIVVSAGTYIDAPLRRSRLRHGYGARHAAAQGVTTVSNAIAIVVSASSSTVTVFHEGDMILELERPEVARR